MIHTSSTFKRKFCSLFPEKSKSSMNLYSGIIKEMVTQIFMVSQIPILKCLTAFGLTCFTTNNNFLTTPKVFKKLHACNESTQS